MPSSGRKAIVCCYSADPASRSLGLRLTRWVHKQACLPLGVGVRSKQSAGCQPQGPPSSPLFNSGVCGFSPSQIDINALAKSSPAIAPFTAPLTSTCIPLPGVRMKLIRSPDFTSVTQPFNCLSPFSSAGGCPGELLANPSSQLFLSSFALTARMNCRMSSLGAFDARIARGSLEGSTRYNATTEMLTLNTVAFLTPNPL